MNRALTSTNLPNWPVRRGKVRDIYDLGDRLLLVATDRISAFDWVLPTGIPDKGRILTQISAFWFGQLGVPHHLISVEVADFGLPPTVDATSLAGRTMLVRKTRPVPFECVVRGYLAGSGWREYQATGQICGIRLPLGLRQSDRLPEPIFTPATKATSGHDENVSFAQMAEQIGDRLANDLRRRSLEIYEHGAALALKQGILIADTKLEWGLVEEEPLLIDEVLTPDSSRFWPLDRYLPGGAPPSFDKQYVRDWLSDASWDKEGPPPALPDSVIQGTRSRYIEALERLTGQPFAWK